MERTACLLDTSNAIAGQGPNTQDTSHRRLGVCGQRMLRDWFAPRRNTVWPEAKVNASLGKLALLSDQQSILDYGICLDQWTLKALLKIFGQYFVFFCRNYLTKITGKISMSLTLKR